jgi:hypothetical protein
LRRQQLVLVLCQNLVNTFEYRLRLTNGLSCAAPSTARASLDTVLLEVSPVRVTWPGVHVHRFVTIVLWALVLIHNPDAYWCAQREAKLGTRLDFNLVLLVSRCRNRRLSRSSTCHLGLNIALGESHTRRTSINDGADTEAMGFAIADRYQKTVNWICIRTLLTSLL